MLTEKEMRKLVEVVRGLRDTLTKLLGGLESTLPEVQDQYIVGLLKDLEQAVAEPLPPLVRLGPGGDFTCSWPKGAVPCGCRFGSNCGAHCQDGEHG